MKRNITVFTVLFALILLSFATASYAAAPKLINYQGLLTDNVGDPVSDGSYSVVFTIYNDTLAVTSFWTETHSIWTLGGRFNVLLGSWSPVEDTVFNGAPRYLGIAVAGDPELWPRTLLVSVPYSHRVNTVDGASGGNIVSKVSIGSGHVNTGLHSFVAGEVNTATADYACVTGGGGNTASDVFAIVSGGVNNVASGRTSAIGGGGSNISSGRLSVIAGGGGNEAQGRGSSVAGGLDNVAVDTGSVVSGGVGNHASGRNSTIGGGENDTASGSWSMVSGGNGNHASGMWSAVAGGLNNKAIGFAASFVGGGENNVASGQHSMIPGGLSNTASGVRSYAAGWRAKAIHNGSFVWADNTNADFSSTGDNQFIIRASAGVGIGTNAPNALLHVNRIGGGTDDPAAVFEITNCGGPCSQPAWTENIRLHNNNSNGRSGIGFLNGAGNIASAPDVWIGTRDGDSRIFEVATANGGGALIPRITVSDSHTSVQVLEITGGSDIVEGFKSVEDDIEPGTVMIIDDQHPGLLKTAWESYDQKVAGVVSGAGGIRPGMYLGQDELNGDIKVAMTGRVYVKCSTENGAIAPGDLLTTSGTEGHAMKATHRDSSHGAVIGKAMSGLTDDTGLVLVLVNLQ